MSIILKGIDLPQTLYTDIRIYWDGRIKKIIGENTMILYKNAQAIQIPKDHGRLIDENMTYIDKTIDGYFEIYAPTILDKERE